MFSSLLQKEHFSGTEEALHDQSSKFYAAWAYSDFPESRMESSFKQAVIIRHCVDSCGEEWEMTE